VDEDLTHLDEQGRARMIDVGGKQPTARVATAEAFITLTPAVRDRLFAGDLPKGDAVAVARIAAIMGAKRTSSLVPLCHPVPLDAVEVTIDPIDGGARIEVTARTQARTGVEMEAMTAAALGAITLYDMVKGLDRGAEIGPVRLLEKSGGRSGRWRR